MRVSTILKKDTFLKSACLRSKTRYLTAGRFLDKLDKLAELVSLDELGASDQVQNGQIKHWLQK